MRGRDGLGRESWLAGRPDGWWPERKEGADAGADPFLDPAITGEAIVIWGERPDKPFDRDTELRLTGEELRRRGATNLAEALELLPDVVVREQGRGGRQIEIRGARKGLGQGPHRRHVGQRSLLRQLRHLEHPDHGRRADPHLHLARLADRRRRRPGRRRRGSHARRGRPARTHRPSARLHPALHRTGRHRAQPPRTSRSGCPAPPSLAFATSR